MSQTVGQRLQELRKLKGYSQRQLGRLLYEGENINENAKQLRISRLEKSESISVETRGRLAKILEVSPTELLPKDRGKDEDKQDKEGHTKIYFDNRVLALTDDFRMQLEGLNHLPAFGKQLPRMVANALEGIVMEIKERHGLEERSKVVYEPTPLKKNGNCSSK